MPEIADPVLADLAALGRWAGAYDPENAYCAGDIVRQGDAFFYAVDAVAPAKGATPQERREFAPIPLIEGEKRTFLDDFADRPGRLAGRTTDGLRWRVSGKGARHARVTPQGYATSAGNSYFILRGLAAPISEFSVDYSGRSEDLFGPALATTALSPDGFANKRFANMWHGNWSTRHVGSILIWRDPEVSQQPDYRFAWNSGATLEQGKRHRLTLRPRGTFMFGYLDGVLAFVTLGEDNLMAAKATGFYIQNHASELGTERHYRVEVKTALPMIQVTPDAPGAPVNAPGRSAIPAP